MLTSSAAVLQGMADALPTHQEGDDSSDVASSYEVIALAVHAYMITLDFRLYGFDENKLQPECQSLAPRLPQNWNAGFGSLSFVYRHKQSSMQFVLRIDRIGTKVEVRGLATGDEKILRFERTVRDVVDSKTLPIRITMNDGQEDRSNLPSKFRGAFVSLGALEDILHDLKVKIIQKLIPKLQKEGYVETDEDARQPARSLPESDRYPGLANPRPSAPRPQAPVGSFPSPGGPAPPPFADFPPPGFEDEHQMIRPPRWGPGGVPGPILPGGQHPYGIGHDDLRPPLLGPLGVPNPFAPGPPQAPGGHGGMHPTFDDPLFTGQGQHPGYGGNGAYDPQLPPGARWEPPGPGGDPRFTGPGQGRGNGGFGGQGGGSWF